MAGVLYLRNLSADGMRIHLAGFYLAPVGYILCIEYCSGKPLLIQAQKKPVFISLMGDQVGGSDLRLVKRRPPIVVLHDWQELRQRHTGNKNDPDPMMYHSVRYIGAESRAFGLPLFHQHFAIHELFVRILHGVRL